MAGGGPMVAFEVKGGKEAAFRLTNALQIFKISNNLGDAKSLITHPATTTHQRLTPEVRAELGIFDTSLRLSIGLEDVDDLKADLDPSVDGRQVKHRLVSAQPLCHPFCNEWPFCEGDHVPKHQDAA